MNKLFFYSLFALCCSTVLTAQTGSVELRTGGGTLVGSYESIAVAYNAITPPLTEAYVIELLSAYTGASETFPIIFGLKSGGSVTNTITLRPAAGNTGETISGSSATGIFVLDNADYIIIDGRPGGSGNTADLKIENLATSGTNANTIELKNGASNNSIEYVHVVNNTQNTAGPRTIVFGPATSAGNSDNLVTNCIIEGGRSGVGSAGTAAYPNNNNRVTECEIFDWGYAGVWLLSGTMDFTLDSCEIYQRIGVNNTIVSGIIMSTMTGGVYNIKKNWFYDLQTTSTSASTAIRGIYAAAPAAGSTFNVENNFISNTLNNLNSQTITGIEFLGSNAYTANIYYNTVLIGGTHSGGTAGTTTSSGIRIGATGLNLNMKNNIAINLRTGGNVNHIGFALISLTGILDLDFNCYFANGTNDFSAYWGSIGYNNLSDYKTNASPNEQNTIFKEVNFVSNVDLHLSGSSIGDVDLSGTPIAGIIDDIDGELRHVQFPYKGADESTPIPVELTSFTANVIDNLVHLKWTTATELNNQGFEVQRQKSEVRNQASEWEKIGFVPGYGTTTEPRSYSFVDDLTLDLTHTLRYRLKQIDFNGKYEYSNELLVDITTPIEFALNQNYPNPFNPSTKISWQSPVSSWQTLKIYDILGNEVATLVDEFREAGRYEFEISVGQTLSLSSGIYFYKIQAGDFIQTKKMILLK